MSIDAASPSVGTEKYLSHAEVESALRQKLGYLLLERPLDLASAEWEPAGGGPPALVRFKFGELVHGYECEIGNEVMGTLHRVTGRILTLYVRSGWRYESPNIRVSPSRAVEIVRGVVGPAAEQWVHKATYYYASSKESAPAHVRNLLSSKMCRLVHVVGGSNGSAIVDSVTGDIWSLGMNESAHGSGNRTSNTGAVADVEPVVVSANPLDSPKPEEVEPEKLVGIVAGSLLASYLGIRFAVAKLKR